MYIYASFYLTWLRRSRVLEIAVIDVHLNHYFPSLSAVLRFGHIYKEAMCACVCVEFLNFWIHYYQWLFNRKIQRWLVQSQGGNFRNVQQPANEGVNRTRVATLAFPSYMQELKKCCWTQCFIRRGFTHAFLIRIIFHRDLSPLTSAAGRSSLKCISSRSQTWTSFSLYKSRLGDPQGGVFLKRKK